MGEFRSLPDDMIRAIVCFSSAKFAAYVKSLASMFRNLFDIIPALVYPNQLGVDDFTEFVNIASTLHASTRVHILSIHCWIPRLVHPDRFRKMRFLVRQVSHRGVMDMRINVNARSNLLPSEIFSAMSLTKLEIGKEFRVWSIPENASLPELQSFRLHSVKFYALSNHTCPFNKLLSDCLQSLEIYDLKWDLWSWEGVISCPTLTHLWLVNELDTPFAALDHTRVSFDTPKLESLSYCDYVLDEYTSVNFESLVEVKLGLTMLDNHDPSNLLGALHNVEKLRLLTPFTLAIFNAFNTCLPHFSNLVEFELLLDDHDWVCWSFLPLIMLNAPQLHTLLISGYLHSIVDQICGCLQGYEFLYGSRLQELEVKGFNNGDLLHLSHFFSKCYSLSMVKITAQVFEEEEQLKLMDDIEALFKVSHECKINVRFGELVL